MINTQTISAILLSILFFSAKSQREYIVEVNPNTGVHNRIDSIPGVNYIFQNVTAFDKNNHRYLFLGKDFGGINHLYCVNALTGSLVSSPVCTINVGEFQYDNSSNKLYALELKNAINKMFVVSLNLTTGTSSIIDTLPFTGYSSGSTFFDEQNHNYVIHNGNSLYSMNSTTGSLTSVGFGTSFSSLCFDNTSGFAYGIHGGSPMNVVKMNMANGTYSALGTFTFSGTSSAHKSLDEINHHYTFSSSNKLYSLSLNTGSVLSSPLFPQGLTGSQNVLELQYDNSNGKLYALHWGSVAVITTTTTTLTTTVNELNLENQNDFIIVPNPTQGKAFIYFNKEIENLKLNVYTVDGKMVYNGSHKNIKSIQLPLNYLAKGVYYVSVEAENKLYGIKRLIVD